MADRPTRRALLRTGLALPALGVAGALAGCGPGPGSSGSSGRSTGGASPSPASGVKRLFYGPDREQQLIDVRRPAGRPGASALTVVLVHGGYWQASYGLDLMVPMAQRLVSRGHAVVNVEYRRVGSGGGWPATFADVAGAIDLVTRHPDLADLPRESVLVGHSAGGHLAAWAGSRSARTPGGAPAREPRRVVSLSGLLDLTAAATAPESGGATQSLMGGTPAQHPDRYRLGDPALLVPAACPVIGVQADDERVIPTAQAADYVRAATRARGRAEAVTVPGDHFTLIDPRAAAWGRIQALVEG
ncbi:hypothetical protein GCM10027596_03210 [Nocardioides korecus]